jgi:hypothetical protein
MAVLQNCKCKLTKDMVAMVESGYVDWDGLDGALAREIVWFDLSAG